RAGPRPQLAAQDAAGSLPRGAHPDQPGSGCGPGAGGCSNAPAPAVPAPPAPASPSSLNGGGSSGVAHSGGSAAVLAGQTPTHRRPRMTTSTRPATSPSSAASPQVWTPSNTAKKETTVTPSSPESERSPSSSGAKPPASSPRKA